ncbi:MAG: hypothetical protein CMK09_19210 [Ponticaulis sp.]|nr:hypothetical protein [Ponticaulis sp.]
MPFISSSASFLKLATNKGAHNRAEIYENVPVVFRYPKLTFSFVWPIKEAKISSGISEKDFRQ